MLRYSNKVLEHFRNQKNAGASAMSELAKGRTLEEAQEITDDDVVEELGGLPEIKLHCSNLGANTLYLAIKDYFDRRQREA